MPTPYNLNLESNCNKCSVREDRPFCNLGEEAVAELDSIKFTSVYPKGSVIFSEGEPARGVFIICSGRVKLTTSSMEGRKMILRIAEAGEVLGLSATVGNRAYEVSGETLEPCQVNSVRRDDFIRFITRHVDACMHSAQSLAMSYNAAQRDVRNLGLSSTTAERLARLLLDWSEHSLQPNGDSRFQVLLTHEEIAEMIGTTRETVTRSLADLKKKKILEVRGSTFVLTDRERLAQMVSI